MTFDYEVDLIDVDTGEVLYKTRKMPFTIGCHDKSCFDKYIDSFLRGVSSNRCLSISITFRRPVAVQQNLF